VGETLKAPSAAGFTQENVRGTRDKSKHSLGPSEKSVSLKKVGPSTGGTSCSITEGGKKKIRPEVREKDVGTNNVHLRRSDKEEDLQATGGVVFGWEGRFFVSKGQSKGRHWGS